jgi:hypothetical protein
MGLLTAVLLALSWFHFAWQYLGITTGIPKNITILAQVGKLIVIFLQDYGTGGLIYITIWLLLVAY